MTGVSECSQQRGNLKDDGYILFMMKYHSIKYKLNKKIAGKISSLTRLSF
ncbi:MULTISPECIES: hypothetical protein [unclassified Photorhabdus]|nr:MULTISPECIES: hypothetical protein [unclassified Photorhabdus]NDK94553.1 hypothetical protein [Photorhabdus laumondii subsp. laumondii]